MKKDDKNGIDEMNIAELPMSVAGRGFKPHTRRFKFRNGEVFIGTSPEIGLPTYEDENYLIGLLALAYQEGFKERKFYFTPYKLFKIMRKSTGGSYYTDLKTSLRKIKSASYIFTNTWYDNSSKKINEVEEGFGLLDQYFLWYEHKEDKENKDVITRKCFIVWGNKLWESIKKGFMKYLDLDFYFSLKTPLSQKLYRILDKWFYKKEEINIDIFELSSKLGMREYKYKSRIIQIIKPSLDELKSLEFIKDYEFLAHKTKIIRGDYKISKLTDYPSYQRLLKTPLTDYSKEVLNFVCEECSRDDQYFKNTISKAIRKYGPERTKGTVLDAKEYAPRSMSRYVISIIKDMEKQ